MQEFQFGMNWRAYSRFVGDVFGAPLAMAGLLAFFMESVFTGLWIFGWFVLIAILRTGYFVLDGFDFGVRIRLPLLSRREIDRRVLINSIGPLWDGNEVWLLTAGGAMFAASGNLLTLLNLHGLP